MAREPEVDFTPRRPGSPWQTCKWLARVIAAIVIMALSAVVVTVTISVWLLVSWVVSLVRPAAHQGERASSPQDCSHRLAPLRSGRPTVTDAQPHNTSE